MVRERVGDWRSIWRFALRVTAIREAKGSPWVEFPTELAAASYTAHRQRYAGRPAFAASAAREDS